MQDIDSYLEKMGVKDPALRRRLETSLPGTNPLAGSASGAARGLQAVSPANAAAVAAASSGDARGMPVLLLCCDAGGSLGGLEPLLAAMELPAFAVCMPEGDVAEAPADVTELATLALKAARVVVPPGSRLLLGGEPPADVMRPSRVNGARAAARTNVSGQSVLSPPNNPV